MYSFILLTTQGHGDELPCAQKTIESFNLEAETFEGITRSLLKNSNTVFPDIKKAIEVHTQLNKPARYIKTGFKGVPEFPSFSQCEQTFFRVATISPTVDDIISNDGWKSGWGRRSDELEKAGKTPTYNSYDALAPTAPFEDRIVQYVRVKNVPSQFPKHSTVVGVLQDPIRSLSVGYHTGFDSNKPGTHMRLDEIEVGPCAKAPECKKLIAADSTEVFKKKGLTPRYSTEGEWAIDTLIPASCIVATYRTKFYKVDDVYYSDSNGNTTGGK